ncbi:hypothetical protein PHJA_000321100 [Phtheirospermum japonicum]|uniref:Uncharacterized protein n=1 Tax=Phtheirospermum japonicum TaxID=374723 RepID=A0A830B9N3_9LAMI|nr:hypothetical protein PHJA_000321100 [Phtheirospermum japonicum]
MEALAELQKIQTQILRRISDLELSLATQPLTNSASLPLPSSDASTTTEGRLSNILRANAVGDFSFKRVPSDYYDLTLESRRDILGAASIHHLCKSIVLLDADRECAHLFGTVRGCSAGRETAQRHTHLFGSFWRQLGLGAPWSLTLTGSVRACSAGREAARCNTHLFGSSARRVPRGARCARCSAHYAPGRQVGAPGPAKCARCSTHYAPGQQVSAPGPVRCARCSAQYAPGRHLVGALALTRREVLGGYLLLVGTWSTPGLSPSARCSTGACSWSAPSQHLGLVLAQGARRVPAHGRRAVLGSMLGMPSTCSALVCAYQASLGVFLAHRLGMTRVILDEAIVKLNPDFFWLGGGEIDLKLGIRTSEFIDYVKPFIINCSGN